MAKYIPDINTKRWIILAPKRLSRPSQFQVRNRPDEKKCVFCSGNESLTPPEVFRIGSGEKNMPGWLVRVVPNLYPITDVHEVIIHSTDHDRDIEDLEAGQVENIIKAFRERYNYHSGAGQVLIFTNHGEATGASQAHPHSQLVVIPRQIKLDALSKETVCNVISEDQFFQIYCPEFSQWPYEVWFAPKKSLTFFGDITDSEVSSLATNLKKILTSIKTIISNEETRKKFHYKNDFAYNLIIYPGVNWYLRIIPRLVSRAGFELGTGIQLNIVDPADASEQIVHCFQQL